MSTAVIVGIVIVGLFILVAIAVTMQTIEKNNKEKRRLETALNSRAKNFQYMLDHFPEGFLGRDLQVLVCKCLLEVYEQLRGLDSSNKTYSKLTDQTKARLEQCKSKGAGSNAAPLTDAQQIKDIQELLSSLFNFIAKLAASKRVSAKEAQVYSLQIRRLTVKASVDGLKHIIAGAIQGGKHRLAIHNLQMCVDKMKKENNDQFYNAEIAECQAKATELQNELDQQSPAPKKAETDESADEWDKVSKEDETWKKKAIYD